MQHVPWKIGQTYEEICQLYIDFILGKYGQGSNVVFDGYSSDTSTKDATHRRCTGRVTGSLLAFHHHMKLTMKQDRFISNKENNQRFINMLSTILEQNMFHRPCQIRC